MAKSLKSKTQAARLESLRANLLALAACHARIEKTALSGLLPSYHVGPKKLSRRLADDELVDTNSAAELLRLKRKTLENWRTLGKGPSFVRVGGRCLYQVAELRRFIASAGFASTTEYQQQAKTRIASDELFRSPSTVSKNGRTG